MRRKLITLFIILLFVTNSIFSEDILVFKDGNVLLGNIISYEKDNSINFERQDGTIEDIKSSLILSIKTNVDLDNVINQVLSPSYNRIQFYPRKNAGRLSYPPRYVYHGQTYDMESVGGYKSEILQFFDDLDPLTIDENTQTLINELFAKIKKNDKEFKTSLITQIVACTLMFTPYITMDDSDPLNITFPDWAGYTFLAGVGVELVGLGLLANAAFFNVDDLLEEIAISYNKNYINK